MLGFLSNSKKRSPNHVSSVLTDGWITTRSTAGAVRGTIFTEAAMIQRARDLQDALNVLAKIKMQKETIATLCQQLVEKLPLELRQMIYEYIMPSRNVNVCDPDKRYFMDHGFMDTTGRSEVACNSLSFSPSPADDARADWLPTHYMLPYQPNKEFVGE